MPTLRILSLFLVLGLSGRSHAVAGKYFDRAIFVIFENANYSNVIKQPYFKSLADQGATFTNILAVTHPSQGNYIALTSGSMNGIKDDSIRDVNANNIIDLLEARGLTWKVYAESFPGKCFTGKLQGTYARKHNPFISYLDIQKNPKRCANIVNTPQFDVDAKNGNLPNYVFYVPDLKNDGHDTGVAFADSWYKQKFSQYINDGNFMKNSVVISTFDESGVGPRNQIYTSIVGGSVKPTVIAGNMTIYSLLNLMEDNWNLGTLGKSDATATPVPNIWK